MDRKLVFLCWSGTRSGAVADALDKAIRELDCGLEPVRSPNIEKGSFWFEKVREALDKSAAAIVCLTPENAGNPWMHFEAGAIAAKISPSKTDGKGTARVYPYLFQMSGVEIAGPLAEFQGTYATEEDTLRLVRELLPASQWADWAARAHDWWTALERGLHAAEDRPVAEILPDLEALFRRKTFDEPLDECVNQAWPARWGGARDTHRRLQDRAAQLSRQCRPYAREWIGQLIEAVDSYAMALELLLAPLSFDLKENGKRGIPAGLLAACEQRRKDIKERISVLADPRQAPVFEDAPRFEALESFAEKKALIHQFEAWLRRPEKEQMKDWRLVQAMSKSSARTSRWDFDRIAFYLCNERTAPAVGDAVDWLRVEVEKAQADEQASHMPLNYCLGPLQKAIEAAGVDGCAPRLAKEAREHLDRTVEIARRREDEPPRVRA